MTGRGTAYQRGAFIATTLMTGQLIARFFRRRTIVLVVLLSSVLIVACTLTWQSGSSRHDRSLIVIWCVLNGAVAGVLRTTVYSIFPTLFGGGR